MSALWIAVVAVLFAAVGFAVGRITAPTLTAERVIGQSVTALASPIINRIDERASLRAQLDAAAAQANSCAEQLGVQSQNLALSERRARKRERELADMQATQTWNRDELLNDVPAYKAWADQPLPAELTSLRNTEDRACHRAEVDTGSGSSDCNASDAGSVSFTND